MGIKIFYVISIAYGLIAGSGIFMHRLPAQLLFVPILPIVVYYLYYLVRKNVRFHHTLAGGMIINLSVQLTGGFTSPLFAFYLLALPIIGYREERTNYWTLACCLLAVEIVAAILKHNIAPLPIFVFAVAILITGIVFTKLLNREIDLKKSLVKYESQDEFFRRADFEANRIITNVRPIDQHKGIERPILYFVKFIGRLLNAHTTAVFAYKGDFLALIQGFSQSELFREDTVINMESGFYGSITAESKPLLLKEFTCDSSILGYYRGEINISSVIAGPIVLFNTIEGLLVVDRAIGQFSDEDKKLFDEATNIVALLLAMLRLYENARHERNYLTALSDQAKELQRELDLKPILASAMKSFRNFMKCDDISIAKIEEMTNTGVVIESTYIKEGTKFTLDDSLVGFVARHKNPIIKDNLREGHFVVLRKDERTSNASFIGLPIKQDEELLGVLWLEDHREKKFNQEDIETLGVLSSQLSLAWQRAKLHFKIKDMAIRDGLTELYNHRHFQEMLEQEIAKNKEFVLLFLDIDHFKNINDTYGHLAGDEVLKSLGKYISRIGTAARYGGEEFTVILSDCPLKHGLREAFNLRELIKKSEVSFNQAKIQFTISIGIAVYPKDANSRNDLIQKADEALYRAKTTGRDKIVAVQTMNDREPGNQKTRRSG